MSKGGEVRSDKSGIDGVWRDIKARREDEVRGRKRLNVVASKGVWNCGEEWANKTFRVPSTD